jgi:hypothetical protein
MPEGQPYSMLLGGQEFYYMNSPQLYAKILRKTRGLSFDPMEKMVIEKIAGMPKLDMNIYSLGMYGVEQPSHLSQEEIDRRAINKDIWRMYYDDLSGKPLETLNQIFKTELAEELITLANIEFVKSPGEFVISTDQLMNRCLFNAATRTFFGSHILEIIPNCGEDLWIFDNGFLKWWSDTPAIFVRKESAARRRLLDGLMKWEKAAMEYTDIPSETLWDEHYGCKFIRDRHTTLKNAGISPEGRAAANLAVLWG